MDYTRTQAIEKQLLDYYILKEYVLAGKRRGYAAKVQKDLADTHEVLVKEHNVLSRVKAIRAGDPLRPSADVSGTPSSREGKDQNYAAFVSLVDIFLPRVTERAYVGLPANQLDYISHRIGGRIVAVERHLDRVRELQKLNSFIRSRRPGASLKVVHGDIWEILSGSEEKFNVFDLDLMCPIEERNMRWAKAIFDAARPGRSLLHLTTTCGRSITQRQHEKYTNRFRSNLARVGFEPFGSSSFLYRDRATPMRCERFVLSK